LRHTPAGEVLTRQAGPKGPYLEIDSLWQPAWCNHFLEVAHLFAHR
jgi:hypothetical protein